MFKYYLISTLLLGTGTLLNRNRFIRLLLLGLFLALQSAITIYGFMHLHETEPGGYFSYDSLGILFLAVLTILSFTTAIHSKIYLEHRNDNSRHQSLYFSALIFLIGAMTSVYLSATIGILWVFVEITTLSVAALIYHERSHLSLEATWKYVFICSVGIAFAFVGIVFLSKALQEAGSVNLAFSDIPAHLRNVNTFWLKLAFIFLVVGFSTKMGLFPMHTIAVDAHTVAPPPISAFISTTLMNVGFVAIFRTYAMMAHTALLPWMNQMLLWCGLLSVFLSAVYILKVNHLKRMFAYSSLEHMGLTAIGLASGGIGYYAAILHMMLHSLVKASAFYQIDQVHRIFNSYILTHTGSYFKKNQTGALVMFFVVLSLTALPPSGMFISEFLLFKSLFVSNRILVFILVMLLLTLIVYALGKSVFSMLFLPASDEISQDTVVIPFRESVSQLILLGTAVYLGYNPPHLLVTLIKDAIMQLPH